MGFVVLLSLVFASVYAASSLSVSGSSDSPAKPAVRPVIVLDDSRDEPPSPPPEPPVGRVCPAPPEDYGEKTDMNQRKKKKKKRGTKKKKKRKEKKGRNTHSSLS